MCNLDIFILFISLTVNCRFVPIDKQYQGNDTYLLLSN